MAQITALLSRTSYTRMYFAKCAQSILSYTHATKTLKLRWVHFIWNFSIIIRQTNTTLKMKTPSLKTHCYNYIVETTSPRTVTLIFLVHSTRNNPTDITVQLKSPLSCVDTLRIVRLTFWGIHVTLTLPLKFGDMSNCPL